MTFSGVERVAEAVLSDFSVLGPCPGVTSDGGSFDDNGLPAATISISARRRRGGRLSRLIFPRNPITPARCRILSAAFALKQNLCGAWASKIADNVDATARLGDSEILAVQHSPPQTIPALGKRGDDEGEVFTLVRSEESRDVFEDDPRWPQLCCQVNKVEEKSASLGPYSSLLARDRDVLARESANHNVNVRTSSQEGVWGHQVFNTARRKRSISTCPMISIPTFSRPRSNPPIPENRDSTFSFLGTCHPFRSYSNGSIPASGSMKSTNCCVSSAMAC